MKLDQRQSEVRQVDPPVIAESRISGGGVPGFGCSCGEPVAPILTRSWQVLRATTS